MKINNIIISLCVALCISTGASAKEIEKGTFEIQGDLNINNTGTDLKFKSGNELEVNSRVLSGSVGYYIFNNLGLGLRWKHEFHSTIAEDVDNEINLNEYGPILFYNLGLNQHNSLKFFGGISRVSVKERLQFSSDVVKEDALGKGTVLGAGFSSFINEFISLNITLSRENHSFEYDNVRDLDKQSQNIFNVGMSILIR